VENVVEKTENRDPKGDKVPLGDIRGATHGKLYLRSLIPLGLMYPPFWFSMLKSKKATLILGGFRVLIFKLFLSPFVPCGRLVTEFEMEKTDV